MKATGFIINSKKYNPDLGCRIFNYEDNPKLKLVVGKGGDGVDLHDNRGDGADVRMIILHTTKGKVTQNIRPDFGPVANDGERVARFWSGKDSPSGAQIVIDRDGDVHCLCDLGRVAAHHASNRLVNHNSIGIEIYQEGEKEGFALYSDQLGVVVRVVDYLTKFFGIQRQVPREYKPNKPIPRLQTGGKDMVGVFGHRDVTTNRSKGDPGDQIFARLRSEGYMAFDFYKDEDKKFWLVKQRELGADLTGVPYTDTVAKLIRAGKKYGQLVSRPGD